jgi:hypothetical protein
MRWLLEKSVVSREQSHGQVHKEVAHREKGSRQRSSSEVESKTQAGAQRRGGFLPRPPPRD